MEKNFGLDSKKLREDADGSIIFEDGTVFHWSPSRLNRLISTNNTCFLCGRDRSTTDFDEEHILPQWILRDFNLENEKVALPNNQLVKYYQYKIPCCERCNKWLGKNLENPIKNILSDAVDNPNIRILGENTKLVYSWLANLQFKLSLKDFHWLWSKNPNKHEGSIALAAGADVNDLFSAHAFLRSFPFDIRVNSRAVGNITKLTAVPSKTNFDLRHLTEGQNIYIKLGRIALFASFGDCDQSSIEMDFYFNKGGYSDIQLIEIFCRQSTFQRCLLSLPQFSLDPLYHEVRHLVLNVEGIDNIRILDFDHEYFGRLFRRQLGPMKFIHWKGSVRPVEEIEGEILEGRFSSLLDNKGEISPAHAKN